MFRKKFPDHPQELIKEWEDHAKKLSGKKDGKFKTRNALACGPQVGALISTFVCFALIQLCGWEDIVYNDKCNSGSATHDYFVYAVRTVVSLPVYLFAAAQHGTRNVFKILGLSFLAVWANLLGFVFLNRVVGLKC